MPCINSSHPGKVVTDCFRRVRRSRLSAQTIAPSSTRHIEDPWPEKEMPNTRMRVCPNLRLSNPQTVGRPFLELLNGNYYSKQPNQQDYPSSIGPAMACVREPLVAPCGLCERSDSSGIDSRYETLRNEARHFEYPAMVDKS